jgi:Kef-type K+ transport system membrane component KefB
MLMFLAGYEIDFGRIRGRPLRLAVTGWLISLAAGLVIAGAIVIWLTGSSTDDLVAHRNAAALVIGLAITTTALGTILPPLRDAGLLPTPLGGRVLAVGAIGEFGPIVAVALLLTTDNPARTAVLLVGFVVLALAGLWLATRHRPPRLARLVTATLGSSAQVAVRLAMLVVVFMLWVALKLGLDALVGAFSAGIIIKAFQRTGSEEEAGIVESKLEGIGFGFLVPFFFVMSGVKLDLKALLSSPADAVTIPVFLVLFLLVRGIPTLVLHRRDELAKSGRNALALFASTQLPMVVVITSIGVQAGAIKASTAAAMVTAGMLSVLIFPLFALRLAGAGAPEAAQHRSMSSMG